MSWTKVCNSNAMHVIHSLLYFNLEKSTSSSLSCNFRSLSLSLLSSTVASHRKSLPYSYSIKASTNFCEIAARHKKDVFWCFAVGWEREINFFLCNSVCCPPEGRKEIDSTFVWLLPLTCLRIRLTHTYEHIFCPRYNFYQLSHTLPASSGTNCTGNRYNTDVMTIFCLNAALCTVQVYMSDWLIVVASSSSSNNKPNNNNFHILPPLNFLLLILCPHSLIVELATTHFLFLQFRSVQKQGKYWHVGDPVSSGVAALGFALLSFPTALFTLVGVVILYPHQKQEEVDRSNLQTRSRNAIYLVHVLRYIMYSGNVWRHEKQSKIFI